MSRSTLLQLARDSIQEVLQAQHSIDREALLEMHPLLHSALSTQVNLYLEDKLRGSYKDEDSANSLLESIIINAKKAAFEDKNSSPITTREYLHCELELILYTPDGAMSERDKPLLIED